MNAYVPATVFSSIDHGGRYAYGNQPPIAQWNLARLAEAMLPLFDTDTDKAVERATAALGRFPDLFEGHWLEGMRSKLGLFTTEVDDRALVNDLLAWMERRSADFTNTFKALTTGCAPESTRDDPEFAAWHHRLAARRLRQPQSRSEALELMRRHNPAFIPRNHRVEAVISAAVNNNDYAPFEELLTVLAKPYESQPAFARYMEPPAPQERVLQTFCGT
jgi:uncharacterized protein YdiU (UPF0061 family)